MATTLKHTKLAEQDFHNSNSKQSFDDLVIPTDISPEEKRVTTEYNVLDRKSVV